MIKTLIKNLLFLSLIAVLFVQCNNKEEEKETYWISTGTYLVTEKNSFQFEIELDNGSIIIPQSVNYIPSEIEDSSRITVTYTIISETEIENIKVINAKIDEIRYILTKEITQLTEANTDSIGNDPITISSSDIWHTKHHLNVVFYYYGGYTSHFINLVKPIDDKVDENGNIILEFKHNANNDPGNVLIRGFVSFGMDSVKQVGVDSINYTFKWLNYYYDTLSVEGTYHYNDVQTTQAPPLKESEGFAIIE